MTSNRRGTILILIVGIAAIIVGVAIAFLARMRTDAEDMRLVWCEAQARIMLIAACSYVQEASRLGWDDPTTPGHEEAFGWIDVRDGKRGPKVVATGSDNDSAFPIDHVARCAMHVLERPPAAVQLTTSYNPIRTPVSPDPAALGDPLFGRPYLRQPDPQPVVANGWPATVTDAGFGDFLRGDRRIRPATAGLAWFRCRRDGDATFVVTCGAGGTLGFRDWNEVTVDGATATFMGQRQMFDDLRRNETIRWYLIEWSPAIAPSDYHHFNNSLMTAPDHYNQFPMNNSHGWSGGSDARRGPGHHKNMGGTISWVQRLREEPTHW